MHIKIEIKVFVLSMSLSVAAENVIVCISGLSVIVMSVLV